MTKKIKLSLLLSIWLWLPLVVLAQTMQEVELKQIAQVSPNAASLGKYGEYPVGLFTGIPNIGIPFYEINSGRIKVPVSISYGMGGIKVEEIASSVGLGWSLNAGGVITRSIRGAADEMDIPGSASFLTTTVKVDSLMNMAVRGDTASLPLMKKIVGGKLDAEPDVFYFSFAGHSGKFMYHQNDGKFYSIPYNKMRIEFIDSFGGVTAFRITDENGLVYEFNEMEVSTRGITATTTTTTAWYLSSIFDPLSNNTVSFSYAHQTLQYETFSSEAHYYHPQLFTEISNKQDVSHAVTKLKEITFNGGKVKFYNTLARTDLPGDSAITEIKVFDIGNRLVKDFDLAYDYFIASDIWGAFLASIIG